MKKNLKHLLEYGDTIELQTDIALKPATTNHANKQNFEEKIKASPEHSLEQHLSLALESSLAEVVSERKMRVRASKSDLPLLLKSQQQLIVTAKKDYGVFQMHATVQEVVDSGSEVTLLLDVHTSIDQIQRREYFRLPLLKEISLNLVGDPPIKGLTQNISAGGIKCLVNSEIRTGATIDVYLEIEPLALSLKGRVLECAPMPDSVNHTILRIQFIQLSAKEQQILSAYIILQQGKREAKVKR